MSAASGAGVCEENTPRVASTVLSQLRRDSQWENLDTRTHLTSPSCDKIAQVSGTREQKIVTKRISCVTLADNFINIQNTWMEKMLLLWITVSACSNSSSTRSGTSSYSSSSRRRSSLSSDSVISSLKDKTRQTSGWSPSRQRRKERTGSMSLWGWSLLLD